MTKKNEEKYPWFEIGVRYFQGEDIKDLSAEYGFNLKYWYRKFYPEWKRIKKNIRKQAEKQVYEDALKNEIDKREKIRENYSNAYSKLLIDTVENWKDETTDMKDKILKQKFLKSVGDTITVAKINQCDLEYIYTKADQTGDLLPNEDDEPDIEGV